MSWIRFHTCVRMCAGAAVLLLFVSRLLASPASGQQSAIDLSLFGGITLGNLDVAPEPDPSFENLMRFGGGAGLCFNIRPGLSLEIEGLYIEKGACREVNDIEYETHLDYIAVSPMLRIAPSIRHSGFYLLAGAEYAFLLEASSESGDDDLAGASTTKPKVLDIKSSLNDTDFGVCAGLGVQIGGEGQVAFTVEGRYVLGLTNILDTGIEDDHLSQDSTEPEWKTQAIYVFAGLRL